MLQPLHHVRSRVMRSALAWSFLATAVRGVSGIVILPLVARSLSSQDLGLWYVFLSLQGIVSLFDLGFRPAITRAAGYVWAGARYLTGIGLDPSSRPEDESEPNYPVLNHLIATMRLYCLVFGIVAAAVLLSAGGFWIVYKTIGLQHATNLRMCYLVFVAGVFMNATGDLWPALLAGVNAVRESEKLLFQSILINYFVIAVGIFVHVGMWALVLGTVLSGLFLRLAGRRSFVRMLGLHYEPTSKAQMAIIKVLWPMAWRTGIVSFGTFLVLSANTLICSAYLSLQATASYGLTTNLIGMLTYVSMIITQIKLPLVNQLRVKGDTLHIAKLWIDRTRLSLLVYLIGGILLTLYGDKFMQLCGTRTRLLPTAQIAVLLLILGLIMHHVLYAFLVVSENQNPFVVPALLSGLATLLLSLWLTPILGIWGLLASQGLVQIAFNNWWTIVRALRGLQIPSRTYWRLFFSKPLEF